MKSTKTFLAVAIVIVGFAYAVGAGHPTVDSFKHCCGPQPEDFRSYYLNDGGAIIPSVEGENGMIITDMVCTESGPNTIPYFCGLQITGGGTLVLIELDTPIEFTKSVHFQTGIPVPAGAEITSSTNMSVTISGYVY